MTYKINGTTITQPTQGRWVPRSEIDKDGSGKSIYPANREFELQWDMLTVAEFDQLQAFFDQIEATGTCVAELPQYTYGYHVGSPTWTFYAYSGCTLREPQYQSYFEEYMSGVTLLIANINTRVLVP